MQRFITHLQRQFVGYVALFIALGGVSYAAISVPANSVGTRQLRKGAVTKSKLAPGVIQALEQAGVPGAAGPQGPAGPQGAKGDTGAAGSNGTNGTNGTNGSNGAPGAPGTAAGFARVRVDGTVEPLPNGDENLNVTSANIAHTSGTGLYCFGGLPFTPVSAMVSPDIATSPTDSRFIVQVLVDRGAGISACPTGFTQAAAYTVDLDNGNGTYSPQLADHRFFIWFEK
jgi:hypothetical protein